MRSSGDTDQDKQAAAGRGQSRLVYSLDRRAGVSEICKNDCREKSPV